MIVQCTECKMYYDDEFRDTGCQHNTFSANDGWNNFKHHPESWYAAFKPNKNENTKYQKWLHFVYGNN